ncbi:hypothetical protein TNCV_3208951 [Trichonephila clavipes]|nr:hypothetical protein TNCV_3208951 [Trichonephila clavipes]
MGLTERILTSHCSAIRVLLATDLVILNHGQVTRTPSHNFHTNDRTFDLTTELMCMAGILFTAGLQRLQAETPEMPAKSLLSYLRH